MNQRIALVAALTSCLLLGCGGSAPPPAQPAPPAAETAPVTSETPAPPDESAQPDESTEDPGDPLPAVHGQRKAGGGLLGGDDDLQQEVTS